MTAHGLITKSTKITKITKGFFVVFVVFVAFVKGRRPVALKCC
jgi:hypothetical protein